MACRLSRAISTPSHTAPLGTTYREYRRRLCGFCGPVLRRLESYGCERKWSVRFMQLLSEELTMRNPEQGRDFQDPAHLDMSDELFHWLAYKASDQKRCEVLQRLRRAGILVQMNDLESGEILCGSHPLVRVFTISHKQIARKLGLSQDDKSVGNNQVEAKTQVILNSIADSIRKYNGIVAQEDVDPDVFPQDPFVKFGNDGFVVGLFFSRDSKNSAVQEVLAHWGGWGVGEEVNPDELIERLDWRENCKQCFDESEFLPRFQAMSHEERLSEIHSLWQRGIEFETTDSAGETKYSSIGSVSCFFVDYSLGIAPPYQRPECNGSPADKSIIREYMEFIDDHDRSRMKRIVQIEQAIRHVVEVSGGEVYIFEREEPEDDEGNLVYEGPSSTMIGCRFPTAAIRDQVSRDAWDSWGMYGLRIDNDTMEAIMDRNEKLEYAARMAARIEDDPDRAEQLFCMKGPAFDELKDDIINAEIAEWETTQNPTVHEESPEQTLQEQIKEAARIAAKNEMDPEREEQLWLMEGPAFDELKDRIIDEEIAAWESTREGHSS